jgi:hypothetical protein
MHSRVAGVAERDEVLGGVLAAARPIQHVVDLEVATKAAQLTRIAVSGEHGPGK